MARKRLPVGARRLRSDGYTYVKQPDGSWKKSRKTGGSKQKNQKTALVKRRKKVDTGWKDYK